MGSRLVVSRLMSVLVSSAVSVGVLGVGVGVLGRVLGVGVLGGVLGVLLGVGVVGVLGVLGVVVGVLGVGVGVSFLGGVGVTRRSAEQAVVHGVRWCGAENNNATSTI